MSDDLSDEEVEAAIGKLAEDHIAKASSVLMDVNMQWLSGPPEVVARVSAMGMLACGHALTGIALMIAVAMQEDREELP